jgi:hypothetical protein
MRTHHANIARTFERNALESLAPRKPNTPPEGSQKARKARAIRYSATAEKHWIKALVTLLRLAGEA